MSNLNAAADARATSALQARALPIVSAFLLGVFVISAAGFVSIPAVHNAAHDQRHAIGFPCH